MHKEERYLYKSYSLTKNRPEIWVEIGKMGKVKICYKDGNNTKLLFGMILSEDEHFFRVLAEDNTEFLLSKTTIIRIKNLSGDGYNGRKQTK